MLIVVAIIGILLSILLPSLASAREKAKTAVCLSNLKQLSVAYELYVSSNNDSYVEYKLAKNRFWTAHLYPYYGDDSALDCPSALPVIGKQWGAAKRGWATTAHWNEYNGKYPTGSYAMNGWIYNRNNQNYYNIPAMIDYPATTPIFSDAIWVDHWIRHTDDQPLDLNGSNHSNHTARLLIDRHHRKKINILFAAGNAKIINLTRLYQWDWSKHFEKRSIIVP